MSHFPKTFFTFFEDLTANNDRDWFNAHKSRYEQDVKQVCLDFISDFGPRLHDISPHFRAIAKGNGGSMFRIYRDTRFSKDKTPYKTHAGLHFRHEGGKDVHAPGFYLHLDPREVSAGVGIWMPPNPVLHRIRTAIDQQGDRWQGLRNHVEANGLQWYGRDSALKRVPRGFDKEHRHGDDLKLKSLCWFKPLTVKQATTPGFVDVFADACRDCLPLVEFVAEALDVQV